MSGSAVGLKNGTPVMHIKPKIPTFTVMRKMVTTGEGRVEDPPAAFPDRVDWESRASMICLCSVELCLCA
jgi:hypothetical protein